jgi:hypothetical protein
LSSKRTLYPRPSSSTWTTLSSLAIRSSASSTRPQSSSLRRRTSEPLRRRSARWVFFFWCVVHFISLTVQPTGAHRALQNHHRGLGHQALQPRGAGRQVRPDSRRRGAVTGGKGQAPQGD